MARLHRLQSGVPEGRQRGRRLPAPRSHRHRHRGRSRAAADGGAVLALQPQPRPPDPHRRALGRVHQVRIQRHAGHAHLADERAGQDRREGGRGHRGRAPRRRRRPAHRPPLSIRGRGLRRLVLSQGHPGAGPAGGRPRRIHAAARQRAAGERGTEARHGGEDTPAPRPVAARPLHRAVGPGLQTQHRRHTRGAQPRAGARTGGRRRDRARVRSGRCRERAPRRRSSRPGHRPQRAGGLRRRRRAGGGDRGLAGQLKSRAIFDGRNLYDPEYVESCGLAYYGIGRGGRHARPGREDTDTPAVTTGYW